jgi:cytochrome c biogenesis protein CcdA
LADVLPYLACGEESAVYAFTGRLQLALPADAAQVLQRIADDEQGHADLIAAIQAELPAAQASISPLRLAQFFRRIEATTPAEHLARVAALDWAGPALGIDNEHVRTAGAVLLVALGLVMWVSALNEAFTRAMQPIASRAHQTSAALDGGSPLSALLLGAVLGLVWSPCSGPLLASALTLAASEGGAAKGALVLGVFGVGAALPLVTVAYASRRGFDAAKGWVIAAIDRLKKVFGLLIALTGVAILTGADKWLEAQVLGLLPEAWLRATTLF